MAPRSHLSNSSLAAEKRLSNHLSSQGMVGLAPSGRLEPPFLEFEAAFPKRGAVGVGGFGWKRVRRRKRRRRMCKQSSLGGHGEQQRPGG